MIKYIQFETIYDNDEKPKPGRNTRIDAEHGWVHRNIEPLPEKQFSHFPKDVRTVNL